MTVAFASLVAILIIERVDAKKGTISIFPLIMAAMISSVYWRQANSVSFTWKSYFSYSYQDFVFIFLCSLMNFFF
jgi:hypothetical protein